jgi:hypothetical protein
MNPVVNQEDRVAAVALGRTVAFLLYSLPLPVLVLGAMLILPFGSLSNVARDRVALAIWIALEAGLLVLVCRGRLPATSGLDTEGFSETAIGSACAVLLLVIPFVARGNVAGEIIGDVIDGFLLLAVSVYFIVKSLLSRRPRWRVLLVLVPHAAQAALQSHALPIGH